MTAVLFSFHTNENQKIHIVFISIGYNLNETISKDFIKIDNNFQTYFVNNLLYGLILMSGFISFGLITIFFISINAYVLGDTIKGALLLDNNLQSVMYNLIHGLLEFPAIYFFYIIGITPLIISIKYLFVKNYKFNFYKEIKKVIKLFIYGVIFLIGAALIEFLI